MPELDVFQKDVGTWDAEVQTRPAPGAPVQVSRGVATNRLRCGGRWLICEFQNETGFEGHGVYGFDPARGKYTGIWVDPMRTFLALLEGTWDPATKTMTLFGEAQRPDGQPMRWRETTQTLDPDTQVFRFLLPMPDGSEFEMMTVTYRRRK